MSTVCYSYEGQPSFPKFKSSLSTWGRLSRASIAGDAAMQRIPHLQLVKIMLKSDLPTLAAPTHRVSLLHSKRDVVERSFP